MINRLVLFNRHFMSILVVGVVLDQLTKYLSNGLLSFHTPVVIIPKLLEFQLVYNTGAAYGFLANQRMLLLTFSAIVIVYGFIFQSHFTNSIYTKYGLTFVMVGAIGNFIDRFWHGYVIDFVNIHLFPLFNIADISINIGLACFIIDLWVHRKQ